MVSLRSSKQEFPQMIFVYDISIRSSLNNLSIDIHCIHSYNGYSKTSLDMPQSPISKLSYDILTLEILAIKYTHLTSSLLVSDNVSQFFVYLCRSYYFMKC